MNQPNPNRPDTTAPGQEPGAHGHEGAEQAGVPGPGAYHPPAVTPLGTTPPIAGLGINLSLSI